MNEGNFLVGPINCKQEVELVELVNMVFAVVAAVVDDVPEDFLVLPLYDSAHGRSLTFAVVCNTLHYLIRQVK